MPRFNLVIPKVTSSRRQIAIEEVRDGIMVLPGNQYRMVLRTSSINFELMSEAERDSLIDSFQRFLNSLSVPIQIILRTRELDSSTYLAHFASLQTNDVSTLRQRHMQAYREFVERLAQKSNLLTRDFYVVIPLSSSDTGGDYTAVKETLRLRADIVAKSLNQLGLQTTELNTKEILGLFYSFYAPGRAKRQPLVDSLLNNLRGNL